MTGLDTHIEGGEDICPASDGPPLMMEGRKEPPGCTITPPASSTLVERSPLA